MANEKFSLEYQSGKAAFERGEYRASIEHLTTARNLVNLSSGLGGEVQMWLVMAYEAAGQKAEAIALCQQLTSHPDLETSKEGKNLLYILQAPQLTRPAEWMTNIPDLGAITESDDRESYVNYRSFSGRKQPSLGLVPEPLDPAEINTKDNQFVWLAVGLVSLTLGGLIWFGL
ncbi:MULTISPECIES: hypothetical protein [Moorena]|uniref:Tetratricopeptide repeat protein n=1 Tax=Moorena producens 3L TaxID=489825 RepID=F4XNJ1_9CYAN|nr:MULTISPECIES: hypothetical protein [Moorena]NEQ14043.1 hypothetical protein [Moorena sp. SIO3E2]NES84467.1 hypothetical protein [Moorena sp. SIO2B7]EGJ34250.1 hypothetical protein LYNGBM3L_24370 [Moorena producens 3L]NEP32863.1 hypothetical protein [Moorena sp. SIO3B2]NEP69170.1 hypothetical protein [Moorena sp. SIO3A5]